MGHHLQGSYSIELDVRIAEAADPAQHTVKSAVTRFLGSLIATGLAELTYRVIDEEMVYVVRSGEMVGLGLRPSEPGDDGGPDYISPELQEMLGQDLLRAAQQVQKLRRSLTVRGIYLLDGPAKVTPIHTGSVEGASHPRGCGGQVPLRPDRLRAERISAEGDRRLDRVHRQRLPKRDCDGHQADLS